MPNKNSEHQGLMRVPLVRAMLADPTVRIVPRAVDKEWVYAQISPMNVTGFNPYRRELYVGARSSAWSWIQAGCRGDRRFNEADSLVQEVLFLVHDYLHCWAVAAIQHEVPEIGFGHAPITPESIEAFTFCHLLTEAVATIGLDYWYLSTIHLDELCELGTTSSVLTVSFHENAVKEYQRFDPSLEVQHPRFFERLARFYCSGVWDDLSVDDLRASPKLLGWLKHELAYGEKQREYARHWLSHLSGGAVALSHAALSEPVAIKHPWQRRLLRKLAELSWEKVKNEPTLRVKPTVKRTASWRAPKSAPLDYRFANLNRMGRADEYAASRNARTDANFGYFFAQWIGAHDFASFPREELVLLKYLLEKKDGKTLLYLVRKNKIPRLAVDARSEPVDIFFPN